MRYTVHALSKLSSVYVYTSDPFGFEDGVLILILFILDHLLSFFLEGYWWKAYLHKINEFTLFEIFWYQFFAISRNTHNYCFFFIFFLYRSSISSVIRLSWSL